MVTCPCCKNKSNKLRNLTADRWKCVRNHVFRLSEDETNRILILEVAIDQCCRIGTKFRVPDDEKFQ